MADIIDFHTHVLPGIDDGSASVEESLALLRMEAEQGIQHVVATPHFYPQHDKLGRFLERRKEAEEILRERMAELGDMLRLSVGAEIYYFAGISDSEMLSQLRIGESRFILLEMPQSPWKDSMYRELENIYLKQDLVPIIAHVDRYIAPFHTYGIPERLKELPVLVQANAGFFLRRSTAGMALRMLKKGQIHLLGSDCHNMEYRKPRLGYAVDVIQKRLGSGVLAEVQQYQDQVLGIK